MPTLYQTHPGLPVPVGVPRLVFHVIKFQTQWLHPHFRRWICEGLPNVDHCFHGLRVVGQHLKVMVKSIDVCSCSGMIFMKSISE